LAASACGTRVHDTAAPVAPTAAASVSEQPSATQAASGQAGLSPTGHQAAVGTAPVSGGLSVQSPSGARPAPSPVPSVRSIAPGAPAQGSAAGSGSATPAARPGTGTGSAPPPSAVPTPGAPPAPGGNLDPIRIGSVGTLSGPAGALLKDAVLAVQVWVKWKNAGGGLGGHTIEYSVADDGADPARHRALVQDFVERRKVIAFVQNQEGLVGPSAADYPTQHGIPVVNTEGGGNYPYDSPMYFPTTSSGDQLAFAMI